MNEHGTVGAEFAQALALHRQGRTVDAACAYEQILRDQPAHVEALVHLGALHLGQGNASAAEALLRRAVAAAPDSAEAHANLAAALQSLGRHAEAARHYEQALAYRSDMLDARFGLAACLQACGRQDAAIGCYETLLAADPAHAEANYGLATLLAQLGRVDDAAARFRAALDADPDFAEASHGLGKLLARGDMLAAAAECFLHALDVDPEYIEARVALGTALMRLDRDDEAMAAFHAVLAGEPEHAEAHNGIGIVLDKKRRHAEAIEHYRAALVRSPQHFDALAGMANSMKNIGRHSDALAAARRAVALRPDLAPAASLLGSILAEIGSMDEARACFRQALALAPDRPEFANYVVQLSRVQPGDDALRALEAAVPRAASFPPQEQCLLHFGLAKAYDDIGERERGFAHLLQANALKRAHTRYDDAATLASMEHIPRVFTAALLAARQGLGDPSGVPVFIVGMPRSGTTLVEQVLASHHAVFGAGERTDLPQAIRRLSAEHLGAAPFPEAVWTMTGAEFRRLGAEYVAALQAVAPAAARITDKLPANFLFIGMIRLMLPNARIIHVQRDPVDTCLSCFSKRFTGEQGFTYDLAELGRYYRAYQRLMAHWQDALPPGAMLNVKYEELVEEFEPQARRLVGYCGLEWDAACLAFYKTSRPVHTASMMQVRQPIYRSSVGRWRPDAAALQPLLDALAEP
ncbi:MAG TPA: sulfotransferase [Acetobacteraceae bacterium]|jgi:tetratricopeptide (TPR) repeat protein